LAKHKNQQLVSSILLISLIGSPQQLQKDLVDLEYVKAVNAHSTYFENNDVIDFIIDITALPDDDDDKDDEVIDLTADDEDDYVDVKGELSKKDSTMDITNR
jgi:hypothetical protein